MNPDQIRAQLQAMLQSTGQPARLTISRSTFNDDGISHVLDTCYGGNSIVINQAVLLPPDTTSTQTVVTGTASFLNVAQMPVTATFQGSASGIDVTIQYQLPATWKFSQSFPSLPATWLLPSDLASLQTLPTATLNPDIFSPSANSTSSGKSFLDLLTFTQAYFIVATSPLVDQVELAAGLNFLCHLQPGDLLGAIEAALHFPDPLVLAGPIVLPSALPGAGSIGSPAGGSPGTQAVLPGAGIDLRANLQDELSPGQMKLTDTYIRFSSPLTSTVAQDVYFVPGMLVGGTLQIEENLSVEIVAEKILGDDTHLIFLGDFAGFQLPSLSQLVQLVGADDLAASLVPPSSVPAIFDPSATLSLNAVSLSVTGHPFAVESVSVSIGLGSTAWHPLEALAVEDIAVTFRVDNPFTSQRSVQAGLSGILTTKNISLQMSAQGPNFTVTAQILSLYTLSLQQLLDVSVPDLPALGKLVINGCFMEVQPGTGFTFSTTLADQPQPFEIALGAQKLALSDMWLSLNSVQGSALSGSLSGTLALAGVELGVAYQFPGALTLRGQFPSLSLKTLVTELCGNVPWPSSFDIDLDQSTVLIQEQQGNGILSLATEIKNLGILAFTLQKQASWGFALGVDLNVSSLAALPGFSVLAPFDAFLGLDALLLVFSSIESQPDFQFPDLANFNLPSLGNNKLTLPPQASGLTRGLNLYAQLNTAQSGGFQALAKYLGIHLNGSVGITLAISLPDPAASSKFFLSINEEIQTGTTLVGELGALLQGSNVGAYLTATVNTRVQGQPLTGSVSAAVLENGVLISGTMQGTIHFGSLSLSNLALAIGLDLEGVPSLGIAATLDVSTFESALAIFFDSVNPTSSLVAGALSPISLRDIAHTFANQTQLPPQLDTVLGLVAVKALGSFTLPAVQATALNQRDLATIASAFKQYGQIALPGTSDQLLLVSDQQGTDWHLTDLSTMKHYSLTLQGTTITVVLQPQLYLAPQPTSIGSLRYPAGFTVTGQIDYIMIHALLNIQVSPQQGILAEIDLAQIVLYNQTFFALTGATGQGGPRLSLATYSRPQIADPLLRDPHLLLSGSLTLLGANLATIAVTISEHGLTLVVRAQVNPVVFVDLNGSVDLQGNLTLQGGVTVGIARTLTFGDRGSCSVNTTVQGQLSVSTVGNASFAPTTVTLPPVGLTGGLLSPDPLAGQAAGAHTPSASLTGTFALFGTTCTLPPLTLNVNSPALQNIADTLGQQVGEALLHLLNNPDQWLAWVHSGVITGVDKSAEGIVRVLSHDYQLSASAITTKMEQTMGFGATDIAAALLAAGVGTAGTVEQGAKSAGNEVVSTLEDAGQQGVSTVKGLGDDIKHIF